MFTNIKALIVITALFVTTTFADIDEGMSPGVIAAIFKKYDVEADEEPDCQPSYIDEYLCPKDETIPCSTIEDIEDYCKEVLGKSIYKQMQDVPKNEGLNALNGCIKYVGFHVVESDHLACCSSEHCEEWLEKTFQDLEKYYDDDDDEMDDDYVGEEF